MMRSVAQSSFAITGLFEAEVLVKLILEKWGHPFVADANFANDLLENAAEVLQLAIGGQHLIEGLPPEHMNLIAAMWYVEWAATQDENVPCRAERLDSLGKLRPSDSIPVFVIQPI